LVGSEFYTAVSTDGGNSFSIKAVGKDVDIDETIGAADKTKLQALAKAYASIVNP